MTQEGTGFRKKTFIVWILLVAVVLTLYLTKIPRGGGEPPSSR